MADIQTTNDVTLYDAEHNELALATISGSKVLKTVPVDSDGEAIVIVDGKLQVSGDVTVSESNWSTFVRDGHGFTATTNIITVSASTETPFMLFKNAAASDFLVRFKELIFSIESSTQQGTVIRIYRDPTITTNGTSITINKMRKGQSSSAVTKVFHSPTISANGTLIEVFQIATGTTIREYDISRYIEEGENLLVTVQGTKTNVVHSVTALFAEENIV